MSTAATATARSPSSAGTLRTARTVVAEPPVSAALEPVGQRRCFAIIAGGWQVSGRSAAGHRTDDEQRLASLDDLRWQRRVRRLVREVLLAREEPHERASLASPAIANRPAQHRVR